MANRNVNKVILIGHLGQQPELRQTQKGIPFTSFSLATNRNFKTAQGEEKEETDWHKATVWGKLGENCVKYLTKGSRVYIEGELRMESWKDKDGIMRKSPEIVVEEIKFLDRRRPQTMVEELALEAVH